MTISTAYNNLLPYEEENIIYLPMFYLELDWYKRKKNFSKFAIQHMQEMNPNLTWISENILAKEGRCDKYTYIIDIVNFRSLPI